MGLTYTAKVTSVDNAATCAADLVYSEINFSYSSKEMEFTVAEDEKSTLDSMIEQLENRDDGCSGCWS